MLPGLNPRARAFFVPLPFKAASAAFLRRSHSSVSRISSCSCSINRSSSKSMSILKHRCCIGARDLLDSLIASENASNATDLGVSFARLSRKAGWLGCGPERKNLKRFYRLRGVIANARTATLAIIARKGQCASNQAGMICELSQSRFGMRSRRCLALFLSILFPHPFREKVLKFLLSVNSPVN